MNDATRRGLRTLLQAGIVGLVVGVLKVFGLIHWDEQQTAAVMALATPLVALGMNLLEDNTSFPALMKAPPSPGQNPVPDAEYPSPHV